jgi:hypothetical protein
MSDQSRVNVTLCFAIDGGAACAEHALEVPAGATIGDALALCNDQLPPTWTASNPVGIWGRLKPRETVLRDGDRIEIYAPLIADPKAARRRRATGRASRKM